VDQLARTRPLFDQLPAQYERKWQKTAAGEGLWGEWGRLEGGTPECRVCAGRLQHRLRRDSPPMVQCREYRSRAGSKRSRRLTRQGSPLVDTSGRTDSLAWTWSRSYPDINYVSRANHAIRRPCGVSYDPDRSAT